MFDQREYHKKWRERNREKVRLASKKWREENPERMEALRQAWKDKQPDLKKYYREYQRKRLGCRTREEYAKAQRKPLSEWTLGWIENNKARARALLRMAVYSKRINKPNKCETCKKETEKRLLHGHHNDYSKWQEVTWECIDCHQKRHGKRERKIYTKRKLKYWKKMSEKKSFP
ncbi:hypothetical protein CCP3SC15_150042 [Gammaproteobacteria bacterium]